MAATVGNGIPSRTQRGRVGVETVTPTVHGLVRSSTIQSMAAALAEEVQAIPKKALSCISTKSQLRF